MTKTTVRDRFWLFASRAHDDDILLGKNTTPSWINSRWSRITPAEGALMLGVPNIIMVSSDGIPVPYSKDAYGYMESFCRIKKVLWSCTGSGGFRNGNEEAFICDLSKRYTNVYGAYFDDFTMDFNCNTERSAAEIDELFKGVRLQLDRALRPMELWSTCYVDHVKKYSPALYDPLDGIIVWNMKKEEIVNMERDFQEYEKLLPDKRKMLGIYIYDYISGHAVKTELMEMQCETGLKWLREGRIEGMVFLTNCVMGIGLSSEYWLRDWIDRVGDEIL